MKEVQLFHNNKAQGGLSKGCGFVFFAAREGATAAIDALNEKVTMEVGFSRLCLEGKRGNGS